MDKEYLKALKGIGSNLGWIALALWLAIGVATCGAVLTCGRAAGL